MSSLISDVNGNDNNSNNNDTWQVPEQDSINENLSDQQDDFVTMSDGNVSSGQAQDIYTGNDVLTGDLNLSDGSLNTYMLGADSNSNLDLAGLDFVGMPTTMMPIVPNYGLSGSPVPALFPTASFSSNPQFSQTSNQPDQQLQQQAAAAQQGLHRAQVGLNNAVQQSANGAMNFSNNFCQTSQVQGANNLSNAGLAV